MAGEIHYTSSDLHALFVCWLGFKALAIAENWDSMIQCNFCKVSHICIASELILDVFM